ncbi:MAG: hypothetical protein ABSA71_14415 [Desulfomonilia bacterium]
MSAESGCPVPYSFIYRDFSAASMRIIRIYSEWAEADDEPPGGVPVEMTRKLNEHRMRLIAKLIVCNNSEKSKITLKK